MRILQLLVDHIAVADNDDRIENLLVLGIMQVREEMRRPRNRVRLARTGRVLDQIFAARALPQHGGGSLRVASSW